MTGWRSVAMKVKLFLIRKSIGVFTFVAIGALAGLNVSAVLTSTMQSCQRRFCFALQKSRGEVCSNKESL